MVSLSVGIISSRDSTAAGIFHMVRCLITWNFVIAEVHPHEFKISVPFHCPASLPSVL